MTEKDKIIEKISGLIADALNSAIDGIAGAGIENMPPRNLMATLIAFEAVAQNGIEETAKEFGIPQSAVDGMRKAMAEVFGHTIDSVDVDKKVKH